MQELKAKLDKLEKEKESLNPNNRDDQFKIRQIENEQEEIKSKLQGLEVVDNAKKNARLSVLERLGVEDEDLIKLNEIILDEILAEINTSHTEALSTLHKEYQQKINDIVNGAEEREAQLKRQNEELQKHNQELAKDNNEITAVKNKLNEANQTLSAELSEKSKKITELSHQVNELQMQVNDALSKRDAAVQEKEQMEKEIEQKRNQIKEISVETDEEKKALVERINSKYRNKSPQDYVDAFEERQRLKEANGGRAIIKAPPLGGDQANAESFRTKDNASQSENGGIPATETVKSFRKENETKRVHEIQQGNEQEAQSGEGKADQALGVEERLRTLEERVARLEVWKDEKAG